MFMLDVIVSMNERACSRSGKSSVKPEGHLSDGSGIQKHSCDELYPMIVRAIVSVDDVCFQSLNALTGTAGAAYSVKHYGSAEAHAKAEADCEVEAGWRR